MTAETLSLEEAAKVAAGNWQSFQDFSWHEADKIKDADKWAIFNCRHRDSDLLEISNFEAMQELLKPYMGKDVMAWSASCWLVGWREGFRIRVFNKKGEITEAFKAWYEINGRLAEYPVLDEEDFNSKEFEATLENIDEIIGDVTRSYEDYELNITDKTPHEVWEWIWDNDDSQLQSVDARGGWPDDDVVERALWTIGAIINAGPQPDFSEDLFTDVNRIVFTQGGLIVVTTTYERWHEDIRIFLDNENLGSRCWELTADGHYELLDIEGGTYVDS